MITKKEYFEFNPDATMEDYESFMRAFRKALTEEEKMLRGWIMSNREKSERDAMYYIRGYLESAYESRDEVYIGELLECIDKFIDDNTERLDKLFPEYAE